MNFDRLGKILSWFVFLLTFLIYAFTAERTVGFWDGGEFIASTYKLQVSHSPGAPLYTIITKFFTFFFPATYIAFAMSLFSALCGAFTVFFVFKTIVLISSKLVVKSDDEISLSRQLLNYGAGLVGALSLVFSHSFWVSSTEAEVYTLFTLMASIVLWLMLLWYQTNNKRLLFLIVFILGLSLGVHYLTLAMVFPLTVIYFFKRKGYSFKNLLLGLITGFLVYFFLNNILFYGLIKLATDTELYFVNGLKLPFHSGALTLYIVVLLLLIFILRRGVKKNKYKTSGIAMASLLFIIGYSTYTTSIIRSAEELPISNDARDIFRLYSFVKYDQYLAEPKPLIKGHYFNAPLDSKDPFKNGPILYRRDNNKERYEVENNGVLTQPNFNEDFTTYFPRMYNRSPINARGYQDWVDIKGKKIKYKQNGKTLTAVKPTFLENLTFLFKYQLGWLNFRYFLWNFVGTQNTHRSSGGVIDGNWASGINWFDKDRIGDIKYYPKEYLEDETRNTYYFLPLLLGLIGFIFFFFKRKDLAIAIGVMFFMLGPAITIFNNSLPIEIVVRDRDYILLGSFMAFSLLIGLGVLGLARLLKVNKDSIPRSVIVVVLALIVPVLMAFKGWSDHDRSHDKFAKNMAKYYLDSCPENAILITNGDNATFPLYYLQEVENYRTDVRVVNFDLLGLDIYMDRLRQKINDANPIRLSIDYENGSTNIETLTPLVKQYSPNKYSKVSDVVDFVTSPNKKSFYNKRKINTMPSDHFSLQTNTEALPETFKPNDYGAGLIAAINWVYSKDFYSKQEIILLDILQQNNFEKPVCFAFVGNDNHKLGLHKHMVRRGFVNQLLPIQALPNRMKSELDNVAFNYDYLMNKLDVDDFVSRDRLHDEERSISAEIYRPLFFYLASALMERNEKDKAKKVLEKGLQLMPDERLPYGKYMFDVARLYYSLGEEEKGRDIVMKILDNIKKDVRIFTSFKPKNVEISRKIVFGKMKIFNIINNEMKNLDPKGFKDVNEEYKSYTDKYLEWVDKELKK